MGNSLGCSASGERLVSAARDGDAVEARMLLHLNPCLARYSTFGGLNSPLHFAAAKGHDEIVTLLLENGADINSRNYCGQTALMQACRYGHWEVVQTLMVYRSNVTRADYLNGRTALHFAATEGHVKCLRLVVADFVSSALFRSVSSAKKEGSGDEESACSGKNYDNYALNKFINKQADGGITALHMAALSGHFDCVHLLLDINANVSAVTFNYGSSTNLIGAGSTPLHYAACSGNLKCCQVLLARGASRLALNCNGWLPVDVARIWGRRLLEPLLSPNSEVVPPPFPPSNFLSLPLLSILDIARGCGLKHSSAVLDDNDVCAVCLERECTVAAEGCSHELCIKCALSLCSSLASIAASEIVPPGSIPCPLCRHGIVSFVKLPNAPIKEIKLGLSLSLCNPCMLQPRDSTLQIKSCRSDASNSSAVSSSSEIVCPVSCSPFPSASVPLCACDDDSCHSHESEGVAQVQSPNHSEGSLNDLGPEEQRLEKTTCSKMFWNRRSCHREQQCNSEIGA